MQKEFACPVCRDPIVNGIWARCYRSLLNVKICEANRSLLRLGFLFQTSKDPSQILTRLEGRADPICRPVLSSWHGTKIGRSMSIQKVLVLDFLMKI
ncbi:hypothetical protein BpHYR1_006753 [Brachionus plicatilis]|uniref:Uncharacterized protein n=1 Tax=Brachionus plicatilis TaxID=10195 RepID=A0A3M7RLJ3_BRAPC|nr:hypothetical protein BpHYR1_006753 [Brachionus plicatilis]